MKNTQEVNQEITKQKEIRRGKLTFWQNQSHVPYKEKLICVNCPNCGIGLMEGANGSSVRVKCAICEKLFHVKLENNNAILSQIESFGEPKHNAFFREQVQGNFTAQKENRFYFVEREATVSEPFKAINDLTNWFAWYDNQVSQALRSIRLGALWSAKDSNGRIFYSLFELDAEACIKQEELYRLKKLSSLQTS